MEDAFTGKQNYALWLMLRMVSHVTERLIDRELSQYGVTSIQAGLLQHIRIHSDEATPTTLARAMFREPTSVSALLTRMEKQGLIERFKDRRSKTLVRVRLTEKGEELRLNAKKKKIIDRIMSQLSTESRRQMFDSVVELREIVVNELAENYKNSYLYSINQRQPTLNRSR